MSTESSTSRTFLLTGGRAPAALDLARQLQANGHRVVLAESRSYALTTASRVVDRVVLVRPPRQETPGFLDDLRKTIREERIDTVIPVCEEALYVSILKSEPEFAERIFTDSHEKTLTLHNKWEFIQLVARLGLQAPKTRLIESREEFLQAAWDRPIVLKPVYSRFATRTCILKSRETLLPEFEQLDVSSESPWVAQQFLSGREICSYSIARDGKLLVHSAYVSGFRAGKGAGICFEPIVHTDVRRWVAEFVRKFEYTGQIAFDFIETEDHALYPLECNPRGTSGIHLFDASNRLDLALGNSPPSSLTEPTSHQLRMVGIGMLSHGILSAITSFRQLGIWLRTFLAARDVIHSRDDLFPSLFQFYSFFRLGWEGFLSGRGLARASTHDIEWDTSPTYTSRAEK